MNEKEIISKHMAELGKKAQAKRTPEQRKQAGDIKDYDSQFKVEMWAYDENGNKAMKKTHKVDFRIHHNDGSYELYEAKGVETSDYKDRRKWLETFWLPFNLDHTYTVVEQRRY